MKWISMLVLFLVTATSAFADGLWITKDEILQLPKTGAAWTAVYDAATSSWGTPNLADQNNKHGLKVLAGAYVAIRNNDAAMLQKTREGIMAAKRTFDASSDWNTSNGVLAFGRLWPAYAAAEDLVRLAAADDAELVAWLRVMQTQTIGTHGRWYSLKVCHEDDAANWAAFAGAARIAIAVRLGDQAEIDRCALILRALLGERSVFPGGGYFVPSSGIDWSCGNSSTWVGVNGPCSKTVSGATRDLDGCPVIDTGDGALSWPPPSTSYPWECWQGWYVQAEILYRRGYPAYQWSNQALRRGLAFMQRAGWSITNPARHVPWIANARYGTSFPVTSPNTDGRAMTWTDWTHAGGTVVPPPTCIPNWSCTAWSECSNGKQTRTCTDLNNCGTTSGKPIEIRDCQVEPPCVPNYVCGSWSPCNPSDSTRSRSCLDQNNCDGTGQPMIETEDCIPDTVVAPPDTTGTSTFPWAATAAWIVVTIALLTTILAWLYANKTPDPDA
jgi:hypothetical protein